MMRVKWHLTGVSILSESSWNAWERRATPRPEILKQSRAFYPDLRAVTIWLTLSKSKHRTDAIYRFPEELSDKVQNGVWILNVLSKCQFGVLFGRRENVKTVDIN